MNSEKFRRQKSGKYFRQSGLLPCSICIFHFSFAFFCILVLNASTVFAAEAEKKTKPPVDQRRIAELITQLGADDYFAREKAQAELNGIGAEALDSLSEAAERVRDVETAERLSYLLHTIHVEFVDKADSDQVRGLLQNYPGMNDDDREKTIDELGRLTDGSATAALCRLVRFERSPALSKRAAIRIIEQKLPEGAEKGTWIARLKAGIGDSPRPAAEWVRSYLLEDSDPAEAVARLAKWTVEEERVWRQFPYRSRPEIVVSLLRRQADLYERLDRPKDVTASLIRMAAIEQGDNAGLSEVVKRLIDRKEWSTLDEVLERFSDRVHQDPLLAYQAARAYQLQNKTDEMERYLTQARQANHGDQVKHILISMELHKQGRIDWAEAELQLVIGMGEATQFGTLWAQQQLAESMHDRQADLEAAQMLDAAVKGMEVAAAQQIDVSRVGRTLEDNRARAHYFYGLHFEALHDRKHQLQHLLEGLADSPTDAEILIALFHVPDLDPTVRDRVRKLIRESADAYRAEIERNRESVPTDDSERARKATPYNQLAWLISNTEGDFNEALLASQESLKITPDNPGHLDTLGRCYFALGDYENAIKNQSRAIELDPNAQQMQRQLKLFQKAYEDQKSKANQ